MNFFDFAETIESFRIEQFIDDLAIGLEEDNTTLELQLEQWRQGKDSKGEIMGYYSPWTEYITQGRKQAGDHYNLFNLGDFYKQTSLWAKQNGNDLLFHFDSLSNNKNPLFSTLKRYGGYNDPEEIFGLQSENKDKFTTIAVEKAIKLLNTNLKFN